MFNGVWPEVILTIGTMGPQIHPLAVLPVSEGIIGINILRSFKIFTLVPWHME